MSRKGEGFSYWILCSTMFSDTNTPKGLQRYTNIIAQRAKVQGFIVYDLNEFFFPIYIYAHVIIIIILSLVLIM